WFIVDAHALEQALPPVRRGSFAPCFTKAGPAAFARSVHASRQVWSADQGYPGDPAYRDFYRDVGFNLSLEELAPFPKASFTGIKYHRVTGRDVSIKEIYDRTAAEEMARRHARHFVERCIAELQSVQADDWNPSVIAPFDAHASDCAFLKRNATAENDATKGVSDHLSRFAKLADQFERRKVDRDFLAQCEAQDNLFPNVDWRRFR